VCRSCSHPVVLFCRVQERGRPVFVFQKRYHFIYLWTCPYAPRLEPHLRIPWTRGPKGAFILITVCSLYWPCEPVQGLQKEAVKRIDDIDHLKAPDNEGFALWQPYGERIVRRHAQSHSGQTSITFLLLNRLFTIQALSQ
jgi:hypothetical protein